MTMFFLKVKSNRFPYGNLLLLRLIYYGELFNPLQGIAL